MALPLDIEIVPHVGAGPFRLGAGRELIRAVAAKQGIPLRGEKPRMDYFCQNALQVEYIDDLASFIGISQHDDLRCRIFGVDPFDTVAEDLFARIAEHDGDQHEFNGSQYCFRGLIVTLWDASTQYDAKQNYERVIWAQIGLGDERYLAAIDRIRNR